MAKAASAAGLSARSLQFRALACRILAIPDIDLEIKDLNFLRSTLEQADFEYTDPQWEWLRDIEWRSAKQCGIDGLSIAQMVKLCLRYSADFPPDDADFLKNLRTLQPTELFNPKFQRLVNLYRQIEPLDRREYA
jgi:hypothetical protein